jgi:hypothetical protein
MATAHERAADPARRHEAKTGKAMPNDLLAALESGELTQDQLRRLITHEAAQLGFSFEAAVIKAHEGTLPRNALGSDVEMLVSLLVA